jgi:hypothetical protein
MRLESDIEAKELALAKPEAIEKFLLRLKYKLEEIQDHGAIAMNKPSSAMGGRPQTSKSMTRKTPTAGRSL